MREYFRCDFCDLIWRIFNRDYEEDPPSSQNIEHDNIMSVLGYEGSVASAIIDTNENIEQAGNYNSWNSLHTSDPNEPNTPLPYYIQTNMDNESSPMDFLQQDTI
jgi:hypothetical protein